MIAGRSSPHFRSDSDMREREGDGREAIDTAKW
ncbi:hypothetical protein PVAP13_5NG634700 [Panicum virgatum]|uniref:Uncharacterized protein n=1 Tax=Panicum virgatum TaxID=38727 RepID=A0A8T0SAV4_PANVG|nr:hypothetical protein PVAP13_5NG634700 [Panicum virgatum]